MAGRAVPIVEAPGAAFVCRQVAGEHDAHTMVVGDEIRFALAVAITEFKQPPGSIVWTKGVLPVGP